MDMEQVDSAAARSRTGLPGALFAFLSRIDNFMEQQAEGPLDRLYDQNKARAMKNPVYADIEKRRRNEGSEFVTMFSEEAQLGVDEWDLQMSIMEQVSRHPWWEMPLRHLADRPLTRRFRAVEFAHQRLTRGWDDRATWSLDDHLCKTLGEQMLHLAETTHGWPQSEEFPTFEDFQAALRVHGTALVTYSKRWDEMLDNDVEEKVRGDAQTALRWVADHLGTLWD